MEKWKKARSPLYKNVENGWIKKWKKRRQLKNASSQHYYQQLVLESPRYPLKSKIP